MIEPEVDENEPNWLQEQKQAQDSVYIITTKDLADNKVYTN